MNLIQAIAYSTTLSFVTLSMLIFALKWVGLVKFSYLKLIGVALAGTILSQLFSLLHEAGHAVVAKFWNLSVTWGGSYKGYNISVDPPIYNTQPITQATVVLGGTMISIIIVGALWKLLDSIQTMESFIIPANIMFSTGLGSVGSVLIIASGDARNFAQGFSKLTGINILLIGAVQTLLLVVLAMALLKKISTKFQELRWKN